MKRIELKLLENDPQNAENLIVEIDDKDVKKALKIIEKANKNMPSPNTIQESEYFDKLGMSDEIDYVLYLFDQEKIKYRVPKVDMQVKIEEGFLDEKDLLAAGIVGKNSGKIR